MMLGLFGDMYSGVSQFHRIGVSPGSAGDQPRVISLLSVQQGGKLIDVDRSGGSGPTLGDEFIFTDGRSGTQIYSEALREERLYNQNDNTPALSSYFELMDEIIPRFLSTLSTQRVRGSRVLIK